MTHKSLSPLAEKDLDEHFLYLGKNSPATAVRFLEAADASFDRLAAMPELGERQAFQPGALAGVRVWQVQGFANYLIFYRPIQDGVEIVRVLHAARDIEAIFDETA